MKKTLLLFLALSSFHKATIAQVTLTGTNYTQNFDNIASGLPTGWSVYTGASATALGTDVSATKYTATPVKWSSTTGGFRNSASATGFASYAAGDTAAQLASTNRALSVRQVGNTSSTFPGSNPGAAFVFKIANTIGFNNFILNLKLQSLDSTSAQTTTWSVDYGIGATPTSFTPATIIGTNTTGGNTFSNNTLNVSFGSALDNQSGIVILRVIALTATTGSNNRTTSGIDDFNLSWTGSGVASPKPTLVSFTPTNGSTNVPLSTNLTLTFNKHIIKGTSGNIYVKDETLGTTQTIAANTAAITTSGSTATVTGVNLTTGSMYHVTFDSTVFDSATYHSYGLYDTTSWRFSAIPAIVSVIGINEQFDSSCAHGKLPLGWSKFSVNGAQQWNCFTVSGNAGMAMNGFSGGNNANEDWLITPKITLDNALFFKLNKRFVGTELAVLTSPNYIGYGDPNNATWTNLNITMNPTDTGAWFNYYHLFTPNSFIAFKYISSTTDGYSIRLDSVVTSLYSGIAISPKGTIQSLQILGNAYSNEINFQYSVAHAGYYDLTITDLTGRLVYANKINATTGLQKEHLQNISLTPGLYVLKLNGKEEFGATKVIIQ